MLRMGYRIWYAGRYLDPGVFIADIDRYLKLAFLDPDFEPDGGLLIEVGGKRWNSHRTFDTVLNMASWFTAAATLAAGKQRSCEVWAWEESHGRITRLGNDLLRLEDPPVLPPVVVGFRDFGAGLLEPGAQLLELQSRAAARLTELCQGVAEDEPPAIVFEWARELPDGLLDERVVRRRGSLVEIRGWSLDHRWREVAEIPMSRGELRRLAEDLVVLESFVGAIDE